MNGVWKFSCILYHSKYGISICPSLWSAMWVLGEIGIGCLLVSALTLISGWNQIRVHPWLIQTSSGEVSSEILWTCYQSCSGCWQIWGMLFVWEFITTDPSSRCSWFILQKLWKTLGFLQCVQFMNGSAKLSNGTNVPSVHCPQMQAGWNRSCACYLCPCISVLWSMHVWRPNSGLSEIPSKLKQWVGTLSVKCFALNVVFRLSSALLHPIWQLKWEHKAIKHWARCCNFTKRA